MKKLIITIVIAIAAALIAFAFFRTREKVQAEINIHINKETIYLSTYSEPPQFAIWLENPKTGECKTVFVTYRVDKGDWEGKANVPVALPRWYSIFKEGKAAKEPEIAVSGATPKDEYFRIRAEVKPSSKWICYIEMNLAGDYNDAYPQFNRRTMQEDEYSCGQPALLYRAEITADKGAIFTPQLVSQSLWKDGVNTLEPIDEGIGSAKNVFDKITIEIIEPKPVIIDTKSIDNQDALTIKKE